MVTDDAALYDGTPVGVQLVGRRLQEESVLALAEWVGAALGSDQDAQRMRRGWEQDAAGSDPAR